MTGEIVKPDAETLAAELECGSRCVVIGSRRMHSEHDFDVVLAAARWALALLEGLDIESDDAVRAFMESMVETRKVDGWLTPRAVRKGLAAVAKSMPGLTQGGEKT